MNYFLAVGLPIIIIFIIIMIIGICVYIERERNEDEERITAVVRVLCKCCNKNNLSMEEEHTTQNDDLHVLK